MYKKHFNTFPLFITFISPILTINNPQKMLNLHSLQQFLKNKANYHIHYNSIYNKKCKYILRPILGHKYNYLIIYCWHANAKMAIFLTFLFIKNVQKELNKEHKMFLAQMCTCVLYTL